MRRRDLLGAAAGAAAAGCATVRVDPEQDFAELYARLDEGLASVGNPFEKVVAGAKFTDRERAFVESSLRSLLVTAAIHELPEHRRDDPGLVARARAHAPDFERALGSARALMQMAPSDRVRIEREIRRDPSLPEKVTELLARYAKTSRVPGAGRFELRSLAQRCAWRMQHQPVSLVMDDTLERMTKVEARLGERSMQARLLLARAQEEEVEQSGESGYDEAEELGEEAKREEQGEPIGEEQLEVEKPKGPPPRGKHLMMGGGIAAGGGLILGAAGFGVFFAAFDSDSSFLGVLSFIMCGVGALSLIVGLIVLIVGIVVRVNDLADYRSENAAP
jgi:hypothetical protein